ncbi:MAG: hypothetical protein ACRCTR_04190 [Actinomycetota bacterium]
MSILDNLAAGPGIYWGQGQGPAGSRFVARIAIQDHADRSITFDYETWSPDGGLQHAESARVARTGPYVTLIATSNGGDDTMIFREGDSGVFGSVGAQRVGLIITANDKALTFSWWWVGADGSLREQSRAVVSPVRAIVIPPPVPGQQRSEQRVLENRTSALPAHQDRQPPAEQPERQYQPVTVPPVPEVTNHHAASPPRVSTGAIPTAKHHTTNAPAGFSAFQASAPTSTPVAPQPTSGTEGRERFIPHDHQHLPTWMRGERTTPPVNFSTPPPHGHDAATYSEMADSSYQENSLREEQPATPPSHSPARPSDNHTSGESVPWPGILVLHGANTGLVAQRLAARLTRAAVVRTDLFDRAVRGTAGRPDPALRQRIALSVVQGYAATGHPVILHGNSTRDEHEQLVSAIAESGLSPVQLVEVHEGEDYGEVARRLIEDH